MPKHMTSYNLLCGKAGCKRNVIRKSAAESFLTGVWSLRSGLEPQVGSAAPPDGRHPGRPGARTLSDPRMPALRRERAPLRHAPHVSARARGDRAARTCGKGLR